MAECTCHESWEAARRRRRRELEDAPTTHIGGPVDTSCRSCGLCPSGELTGLLAEQNRLLYDILGAVNALTAARLAEQQTRRT